MLRYVSGRFKRASLPSNSNPPLGERNASCGGQSNTSARALRPQGLKTSSDKAWEVSWVSPARRSASGNRQGATLLKRIIAKQAHSYMCPCLPAGLRDPQPGPPRCQHAPRARPAARASAATAAGPSTWVLLASAAPLGELGAQGVHPDDIDLMYRSLMIDLRQRPNI